MYDELTEVDIQKMREELEYRYTVLGPELGAEVKRTREYGDLSENAEYKEAKRARNKNRSRIRYLEAMIRTAKVIEVKQDPDRISLFDRVTYRHEERGITKTVQIVTTLRQDALVGYLSKESPLGQSLLGRREGDRIRVTVNENRAYDVTVLKVEKGTDNADIPISSF